MRAAWVMVCGSAILFSLTACGGGTSGDSSTNSPPIADDLRIDTDGKLMVKPGDTLAAVYSYHDPEGDHEGQSQLQWLREGIAIDGEVGRTYELTDADDKKAISFRITPIAQTGASMGDVKLSPVVDVGNEAPAANDVKILVAGGASAYINSYLRADYVYSDAENDDEGDPSIRWLRDGTVIEDAEVAIYQAKKEDVGHTISVEITPTAVRGTALGERAVSSGIEIKNSLPLANDVYISAKQRPVAVGDYLTCHYQYLDADGDPEGATLFRWLRTGVGANSVIPNAAGSTYKVDTPDFAANAKLRCEVIPMANQGATTGVAVLSPEYYATNAPPAANHVRIVASSTPAYANTNLTALYTYSDADGDPEGDSLFTWSLDGAVINSGGKSNVFSVGSALRSKLSGKLSVSVTPVARTGTTQGATVAGENSIEVRNSVPTFSYVRIESYSVNEYKGRLIGYYSYYDIDSDTDKSTFRWLISDSADGPATATGVTTKTYTVDLASVGKWITFEVTFDATGALPAVPLVIKSVPIKIKSYAPTATQVTIVRSQTLSSVVEASYVYSDFEGDQEGDTQFQWKRDGVPIAGETARAYTLGNDGGHTLTVDVTPIALTGEKTGTTVTSTAFDVAP